MENILARVDLATPLPLLLRRVVLEYNLGKLKQHSLIREGYEELNVKIVTEKGVYVVKIFSKGKPYSLIKDYAKGLVEFHKAKIPVPDVLKHKNQVLYRTAGKKQYTYLLVMDFFNGKNFTRTCPDETGIRVVVRYLAKIHKLSYETHKNYDSWGTANLLKEFKTKGKYLEKIDLESIQLVAKSFQKIQLKSFRKSIIHGDLQRQHVLKNGSGKYCLLDMGCVDFNSSALDLAIFLTLFCLDVEKTEKNRRVYDRVIKEYLKLNSLSEAELDAIPTLVKATYAIYAIASNYRIKAKKDYSKQTRNWLSWARKGLSATIF